MGKLYLFEGLVCFRAADVVWVLILLQRGFSFTQVGIAEAVFHITSMICEIPSGMMADLFGRKRTLCIAGILGSASAILMGFGNGAGEIYLGMMFSALNYNFISGTEEALMYDSLIQAQETDTYKKRKFQLSVVMDVMNAMGCLIGPTLLLFGYRKLYLISASVSLFSAVTASLMQEPCVTQKQMERAEKKKSETEFEIQNQPSVWEKQREVLIKIKNHICDSWKFIFTHPRTMCKLFADAAVSCPSFLTLMYLQKHLVNCGMPQQWIGIPILLIPLSGSVGSFLASKMKTKLFQSVMVCGIVCGIGTCIAGSSYIFFSVAGAVTGRISMRYIELLTEEAVNKEFESDQRATMVSVDSMFYSVLMILASMMTGWVGNRFSVSAIFFSLGGILIVMTVLAGIGYKKMTELQKRKVR